MTKEWRSSQRIGSIQELKVYQLAFEVAMTIFDISKSFPKEERYSLTDQIRRSSRSVCANLAECWRKRKYRAVFLNKLSDCAQEASETQTWLEFSYKCGYINKSQFKDLFENYEHIFAMIYSMEKKVDQFCF